MIAVSRQSTQGKQNQELLLLLATNHEKHCDTAHSINLLGGKGGRDENCGIFFPSHFFQPISAWLKLVASISIKGSNRKIS